jgi:hypothetical protein
MAKRFKWNSKKIAHLSFSKCGIWNLSRKVLFVFSAQSYFNTGGWSERNERERKVFPWAKKYSLSSIKFQPWVTLTRLLNKKELFSLNFRLLKIWVFHFYTKPYKANTNMWFEFWWWVEISGNNLILFQLYSLLLFLDMSIVMVAHSSNWQEEKRRALQSFNFCRK